MTEKQRKAQARNWNKRMLSGAVAQLLSMATNPERTIGLTTDEKIQIEYVSGKISKLLELWQPSI